MDEKGLGKRIQQVRKDAGFTQQGLCQKTGLSYSTLAKIERGAIKTPSVFTIQTIAGALNITLDELLASVKQSKVVTSLKRTSKSGISFVYFDLNGCLVRSFQRAFDMLAQDTGAPKDIIQATYEHYDDAVCRGDMQIEDFNEALSRQVHKVKVDWADYYLRAVEPVAGMFETLEQVAGQYRTGILSNTMPTLINSLQKMGKIPQLQYDAVIESCNVKVSKPNPAIFAIAAEAAGVNPSSILLIDDTRTNLQVADSLGWQTLWFDDYFPAESISSIKATLDL